MTGLAKALLQVVALKLEALEPRKATLAGTALIHAAMAGKPSSFDSTQWLKTYATVALGVAKAPLTLTDADRMQLAQARLDWPLSSWSLAEAARVALTLIAGDGLENERLLEFLSDCYRQGDTGERTALLKALPFLAAPALCIDLGVEACRSSVQPIFEAIACENPFPAGHFPDLFFNQMVLKALFVEVPLERIVGLRPRVTPELQRMANDYAAERRSAGRPVPKDLVLLTQ